MWRRRHLVYLLFFCLIQISTVSSREEAALDEGMVNLGHHQQPAWFKNSFLDLHEDVVEARQQGKRVILYFYQDGCPYCARLLKDNFFDPVIGGLVRKYFDVIAINLWGDREVTDLAGRVVTEKQFAQNLKVQYTPSLLFLDEQGQKVVRLNGYYAPDKFQVVLRYVAQHKEKELTLRDYYAQSLKKPSDAGLLQEPFFLAHPLNLERSDKVARRPLAVLFEQSDCAACAELHQDMLQQREVVLSLAGFDVAQLDVWSQEKLITPSGKQLSAREWAAELNIQYTPGWVFFDGGGREVFRVEAWLRTFHLHSAIDYAATRAYEYQPNFQRFIQRRADVLRNKGFDVDLLK